MPYSNIEVGSIVTAYKPGFWKVLQIIDRTDHLYAPNSLSPLAELWHVATTGGLLVKGVISRCALAHCKLVTPERVEEDYKNAVRRAEKVRESVLKILDNNE